MSNGNPTPAGSAPAKKKGLPPIAWVAIGCGGLIILALVAFLALGLFAAKKAGDVMRESTGAESVGDLIEGLQEDPMRTAAEMAVRMNPELELISTDDDAGTITFRDKNSGEVATLNFEDIAEGRFSVTTDEGEYSVDAGAAAKGGGVTFTGPEGETRWGGAAGLEDVPDWVPLYPDGTDTTSVFSSRTGGAESGAVTAMTSDNVEKVIDYYKRLLEDRGYRVSSQSITTTPQGVFAGITGELDSEGRTLNVAVTGEKGELQVMVNYNQAAP